MTRGRGDLGGRLLLPGLVLLLAHQGLSHPQCLDYKPPFQPREPLVFCKAYAKFGCCDLEKDEEISQRFYKIMDNFDYAGYVSCGKYIRSILCQVEYCGTRLLPGLQTSHPKLSIITICSFRKQFYP